MSTPAVNRPVTRLHWMLDDEADGYEIGVHVEADPDGTATVMLISDASPQDEVMVTGPAGAVLGVIARAFHDLRAKTDDLGPECFLCAKRGLNRGSYAVEVGNRYVHLGCSADEEHARTQDRHLKAVPDQSQETQA